MSDLIKIKTPEDTLCAFNRCREPLPKGTDAYVTRLDSMVVYCCPEHRDFDRMSEQDLDDLEAPSPVPRKLAAGDQEMEDTLEE